MLGAEASMRKKYMYLSMNGRASLEPRTGAWERCPGEPGGFPALSFEPRVAAP